MTVFTLLVCTVGGSPDPLVASLCEWKPEKVFFIPSIQTRSHVDTVLRCYAEQTESGLRPGQYDIYPVPDAEELAGCLKVMRQLDQEVYRWISRGAAYQVVADFTAGTKCMTAALALQARRWPCRFSYVAGSRRSKEGVGIVETGFERVVHWENPWNALGHQAVEDACLLFDQQAYTPAAMLLDKARKVADDLAVKRTLSTFFQLCEAYGLWDRFNHNAAAQKLDDVLKNVADLQAALGPNRSDNVIRTITENRAALQKLIDLPRSRGMVADLLANAKRRCREARWDDGVARLYRAIEWIAQLALAERHGISNTSSVLLECVPEPLREKWQSRAENGKLALGLQDAYLLLDSLGDEAARTFKELKLDDRDRSPLTARNQSILAHGAQPVGKQVFDKLWSAAMTLGGFSESDLPTFPRLATNEDGR